MEGRWIAKRKERDRRGRREWNVDSKEKVEGIEEIEENGKWRAERKIKE